MRILKPWMLHLWAILIAVILWVQVHGEGEGSLSLDVPIQLQGLPDKMVLVNNIPSEVRITVQGLQARLKSLQAKDLFMSLDVSDLTEPGVTKKPFGLDAVRLPAGLKVEKVQPDHLSLQVDRVVMRTVAVQPKFDLPEGWEVQMVSVQPAMAHVQGPEVWLESLLSVETLPLKLELQAGEFALKTDVIVPTGKSVHLDESKGAFAVSGILSKIQPLFVESVKKVEEEVEDVDPEQPTDLPAPITGVIEPQPTTATEEVAQPLVQPEAIPMVLPAASPVLDERKEEYKEN